MRKAFLLAHFFLFQCCLLFGQDTKYVSANQLNLRQQPDKNGVVIQALPRGAEVEVLEEYEEGWSKVSVDGREGYVSSNYLIDYIQAPTDAPEQSQQVEAPRASPQSQSRPSTPKAVTVYICEGGSAYAYHRSSTCSGLNRCTHTISAISKTSAENDYGRRPCKKCY
jgi:mannosyl-glycoprotein endo-beta-N-acetylglucosaminidase